VNDIEKLRAEIYRLIDEMDAITATREPTQEELDYYPNALRDAKVALWNAELAGKTVKLPGGGTYTFDRI